MVWSESAHLSFVTAFYIYIAKWREVTTSLPQVDRPEDVELVQVMKLAIRPV